MHYMVKALGACLKMLKPRIHWKHFHLWLVNISTVVIQVLHVMWVDTIRDKLKNPDVHYHFQSHKELSGDERTKYLCNLCQIASIYIKCKTWIKDIKIFPNEKLKKNCDYTILGPLIWKIFSQSGEKGKKNSQLEMCNFVSNCIHLHQMYNLNSRHKNIS